MRTTASPLLLCVTLAAHVSCASRSRSRSENPQSAARPGETLAVLLIDEDQGIGRAVVSNAHGQTELQVAFASTSATPTKAPTPVAIMSEAEVQTNFRRGIVGVAAAHTAICGVLPVRVRGTDDGKSSRSFRTSCRPSRTTLLVRLSSSGTPTPLAHPPATTHLGLSRARIVRDILVSIGLESAIIQVISHGEADQLVPTADEIIEPRNRRVEIMVR